MNSYLKNREERLRYQKEYNQKNGEEIKIYKNKYYLKNKKEILLERKSYYEKIKNTEEYKNLKRIRQKRYAKENPEKIRVHNLTNNKIKIQKGKLCDSCKTNKAKHKHHKDYTKPLEVEFLCIPRHNKIHLEVYN